MDPQGLDVRPGLGGFFMASQRVLVATISREAELHR